MSYILDALRKSEERRKQNLDKHKPLRTARIGKQSGRTDKKRIGGLILTGCILLAVILLGAGWWWVVQDSDEPVSISKEVATKVSKPSNVQSTEDVHSNEAMHQSQEPLIKKSAIEKQPVVDSEEKLTTPTEKLVFLNDLTPELQAQISDMKFSGHVYSLTPALRMIMIDNVVAREGDTIASNLKLMEITENGLIMQIDTTRFQMNLF